MPHRASLRSLLILPVLVVAAACGRVQTELMDAGLDTPVADAGAERSDSGHHGGADTGRDAAPDAPCVCPDIWSPVCGVDGQTYSNECEAACAGVELGGGSGACPTDDAGHSDSARTCGTSADCVKYPDGVGGCCGACLAVTEPRPLQVQCFAPCSEPPTDCLCVQSRCTAVAR